MRSIPISALGRAALCDEPGQVPAQQHLPLTRRELLRGSGLLLGQLSAGSLLAALAPSTAWAVELKVLTSPQGRRLLALGRVLFPHKKLPDAVYALLVKDLDAKAAQDGATRDLLAQGLAALGQQGFDKAAAAQRLALVKALEGQPFFNLVRGQCVSSLYDNDMAFAVFGYPGSAWEKGGYITRGFQDLKWLPAPPPEASPPPFIG
ncbi:tat (twin-arginine translocation) pathway signal sequence [Roseateles sp. BYS180W]|uniref:Tat (Twin-arginine translocation) pathway signal sequence n=1 Tax=Roseateles rivi TaxID=3299028 RepID=A0ABW7FWL3_9BURK